MANSATFRKIDQVAEVAKTSGSYQYTNNQNMKNILTEKLLTIKYRRFVNRSLEELARGLFLGTVGVCIFTLADRLIQIPVSIVYLVLISLFGGVCFGLFRIFQNQENLLDVAKFVDRKFDFKERVSTAYELRNNQQSFQQLQIKDAEKALSSINVVSEFPYSVPSITKFIPISLALIIISFFIPELYDSEIMPSNLEKEAMLQTAEELEKFDKLSDLQTNRVIKELRKEKLNAEDAQKELAKLNSSVRKRNADMESDLSKKLENIIKQEFPSKLRNKLVKDLKERELDDIQFTVRNLQYEIQNAEYEISDSVQKAVQEIADQAQKIAQLKEMSRIIQNGQQRIGLASLDRSRREGVASVANPNGKPGDESGKGEAIGMEVGDRRAGEPEGQKAEKSESQKSSVSDLSKPASDFSNNQDNLRLKGMESDSKSFSLVYSPGLSVDKKEAFAQYRDVYLASKQKVDEAIRNGDIPVRYRQQVKDYFEGIAPFEIKE